jgi:hypothetical protein
MPVPPVPPDAPLQKPAHLRSAVTRRGWVTSRPAAAAAAVLGLASFIIVAVVQPALWSTPDWRISVPGLVAAATAALISLARREPAGHPLWLAGLGLAGAAVVLGWFLVGAIVIGAMVVLILILHAVM